MPPTKFSAQSNIPFGSRCHFKLFKIATVAAILDIKTGHSESLCCSDASHQVSAQSDTVREEMSFEDFKDGRHGDHLGYWNEMILTILNLHVAPMPSTKFGLNPT